MDRKEKNRYFIDPFGCVKNQVDAENMMAHLNKAGWASVTDANSADLIIVNSCGFIESAKQESINAVMEWRKHYPEKKIILTGCLSQRYANDLKKILPEANAFMGVEDISQIVKMAANTVSPDSNTDTQPAAADNTGERPLLSLPGSAYVKISEGCNNRCSYCAIPLIRGNLVSRAIDDIAEECRALLKRGIIELNIIGQDIGAYGMDMAKESQLPDLLNEISKLEENFWVRLLYIHPDHFPLKILDLMERDKRFLPYFDIPFQHASEKILTAMNRNNASSLRAADYRLDVPLYETPSDRYLSLLETIRTRLPNAVIRSTFLLGFPGETEEDFAALLDFQKKANLDWLGCFAYSREDGTASYSMKDRVPMKTACLRKEKIEEKQITITEKNMERFAGGEFDVLIEERFAAPEGEAEPTGDTDDGEETLWLGRLYCQAPDIDGATVIISDQHSKNIPQTGKLVRCNVITRRGFDLEARV